MSLIDDVLARHNLRYEQLNPEERGYINDWYSAIQTNAVTISSIRGSISNMREAVERELADKRFAPDNFVSLLSLFLPVVGIIRRWYQDQQIVELKARLKNYLLIEAMVTSPEKAKEQMDRQIAAFASTINKK